MAYAIDRHQYKPSTITEVVKYEKKQFVEGGFFLGFGSIRTTYLDVPTETVERKADWCEVCGEPEEHQNHTTVLQADKQ